MIYYDEEGIKLANEQISYIHRDERVTKPIGNEGRKWWEEFEKEWEDMKIIEIKPYKPTKEQIERYEVIKDLPLEKFAEALYYMEKGKFPKYEEPEPIKEATLEDLQQTQFITMEAIADLYELIAMQKL